MPDGDAPAWALAASQALFSTAPLVVLAPADDPAATSEAAELATRLRVPLLLTPLTTAPSASPPVSPSATGSPSASPDASASAGSTPASAVREEIGRLGATTAIAVGAGTEAFAADLEGVEVVERGDDALPRVQPGAEQAGTTVLLPPGEAGTTTAAAAAATAQAAGARVVQPAAHDPRLDPAAIQALAAAPPSATLALGSAFGTPELLAGRVATAATGQELPGGGQVLLPGRRLVALYGNPRTPALGVLGEQGLEESIERAKALAEDYQAVSDVPVVPAFELITTVASSSAGDDGDYSNEMPVEELRPWVDAAREAGIYLVLDLQPGRTDFLTQAKQYEELLRQPHVGLALDPEWRLQPGQVHLRQIGSVGVDEVNAVGDWLAQLTREQRLPQKLLLLHQFKLMMITGRERVDTSHDELAVLVHADGFGTPQEKLSTYRALVNGAPPVHWGWKNFYDEDRPMFTPAQTVALDPAPLFISFQ